MQQQIKSAMGNKQMRRSANVAMDKRWTKSADAKRRCVGKRGMCE